MGKSPKVSADKESIIVEMMNALEKGIERGEIVPKIAKKRQKHVTTIDRYWKIAKERYQERQQAIQEELLKESTAAAKERLKKAILTKDERMEIASKIAKGEAWKVQTEIIIPTAGDRMKALDYLSKVEGDYITKVAQTDTDGNDVPKVDISRFLTFEQMNELYNELGNNDK